MRQQPLVSAVIPTRARPHLVVRAVHSALAQSLADIEVIVVIDGRDDATHAALSAVGDPRLRTIMSPHRSGPGASRNRGVGAACGEWIAFLDDDDTWDVDKLERQLAAARAAGSPTPIVSCRLRARCGAGESLWPHQRPAPGEAIGDYLFCRRSLFGLDGLLQTSTLFVRRESLLDRPFREDLSRSEDLDWVLRATYAGAPVAFAGWPRPLVTWNIDDDQPRLSHTAPWREALDWIGSNRHLVSRRAYASYLLTWVSLDAARQGRWRDFVLLWTEARRHGDPSALDALLHAGHWILPRRATRGLSLLAQGDALP